MAKRVLIFIIVLALVGAGFIFRNDLVAVADQLASKVGDSLPGLEEKVFDFVERSEYDLMLAEQRVNTPGPLRALLNNPSALLTVAGTIEETNKRRTIEGLEPLTENTNLRIAAQNKLQDMFAQEYFEHISPDGTSPGKLVEAAGYEYVTVGENLALGNYADDIELVQAWMDSPPHRENILTDTYTEIGVAVGKGMFEGEMTWLAVQEFGRPLSLCPSVDAKLAAEIDQEQEVLDELDLQVRTLFEELETTKPQDDADEETVNAYNEKIDQYNKVVRDYNAKGDLLKTMVGKYNAQVKAFNVCLDQ